MPTEEERRQLNLHEGVPIVELRRDAEVELHPADAVTLVGHED